MSEVSKRSQVSPVEEVPIYYFDKDMLFTIPGAAQVIRGEQIIPENATKTKPNEKHETKKQQYDPNRNKWFYIADHRGKTVYDKETLVSTTVKELGEIKPNQTFTPPPTKHHRWNNGARDWSIPTENNEEYIKELRRKYKDIIDNQHDELMDPWVSRVWAYNKKYGQAKEYATNNFEGPVGVHVQNLADNEKMTAKAAAELIIWKGDFMDKISDTMESIRMTKIQLNYMDDEESMKKHAEELCEKLKSTESVLHIEGK